MTSPVDQEHGYSIASTAVTSVQTKPIHSAPKPTVSKHRPRIHIISKGINLDISPAQRFGTQPIQQTPFLCALYVEMALVPFNKQRSNC